MILDKYRKWQAVYEYGYEASAVEDTSIGCRELVFGRPMRQWRSLTGDRLGVILFYVACI